MASNRIGRINEEIQRELSGLLRTVKDPRVGGRHADHHPCGHHQRPALQPASTSAPWTAPTRRISCGA